MSYTEKFKLHTKNLLKSILQIFERKARYVSVVNTAGYAKSFIQVQYGS